MRIYRRKDGGNYHVEFQHEGRQIRRSLKTKDAKAARKAGAKIYRRVTGGGPVEEHQQKAPSVNEMLIEYEEELERRGRSAQHVKESISCLHALSKDAKASLITDLTTPALERAFGMLSDRSSRTQNKVLAYVRSWCRWMHRTGRIDADPSLPLSPVKSVRVHHRRPFSPAELAAITESPWIPEHRRLLYLVAAHTGLRRKELDSLRWSDVVLEGDNPGVTVRAAAAKNNKTATIPIPASTAERWAAWDRTVILPGEDVAEWPLPLPYVPQLKTFYWDCNFAGVELQTAEGEIDFHSFRLTYASLLATNGVGLAMAQKLMRHSTPHLTASVYTRFQPEDRRAAVESIIPRREAVEEKEAG